MSREWKPGDVAMVNSWRGDGQIAFRTERIKDMPRWCVLDGADTRGLDDDEITAIRPLVVIDPEDAEQVERLADLMWAQGLLGDGVGVGETASAAECRFLGAALREFADPKPRIEEPTGLGAVVADADGHKWTRANGQGEWFCECGDEVFTTWAEFTTAVEVLSEGVTS